jgi:hypothetical protein
MHDLEFATDNGTIYMKGTSRDLDEILRQLKALRQDVAELGRRPGQRNV